MKRTAFVLLISLGQTSAAFAGEGLIASATRVVRERASQSASQAKPESHGSFRVVSVAATAGVRESSARADVLAQGQGGGAVASSGMGKKTKLTIYLGVIAGFVGTAYAIDHNVRDVTPSTLGTRQD